MLSKSCDVVIIGGGIGGLGVGSLMAKNEGKRVILVEKEAFLGGRAVSFVGNGKKVRVMDVEMNLKELEDALASTHTWVARSQPDMETIFANGLLDGYTFEAGLHGSFWGNKGRVGFLMNFLGKPIKMKCNVGLAVVDSHNRTKFYQLEHGAPYTWMNDGGKDAKRVLRDIVKMSYEEIESYEGSLGDFLAARNINQDAYEFIKVLISSQVAMAEPYMIPFKDIAKYHTMARDIDMDLISGSVATMDEPGFTDIAAKMADLICEHSGEVRRGSPVIEVIIENGHTRGVMIETTNGTEKIEAPIVVCNIPVKHIFQIIPEKHFPVSFVKEVHEDFWSAGLLSGLISLNKNLLAEKAVDPRSFIFLPSAIRDEGFIGNVDFIVASTVNLGAHRAPSGHYTWEFSIALTDQEMRTKQRVDRVIDETLVFLKENFADIDKYINWYMYTASAEAYGNWRPVGRRRPDVKCPWIDGLYFVGDQYGERLWGGGVDGAALSAALCVDSITGKNYEKLIFPAYHLNSFH